MNSIDWIKIGIIAKSEFDIPNDAEIHIVPSKRPYAVKKLGEQIDHIFSFKVTEDIISNFRVWHKPEFDFDIGIGYSECCKILAICKIPRM